MKQYEKYKDSGIEWIGEIPSHWSETQLKYVASITKGKKAKEDFQDFQKGMIPYLGMEYLRNLTDSPTYVFENDSNIVLIEETDLLILWDGSKAGEIVKAKPGALSSTMGKIHITSNNINVEYLTYYLKSSERFLQSNTVGMGIPHVSGEILRTLFIPVSSLNEQTQIVNFLDHQTAIIDDLIKQKEKLITLLKEKRQAIINETVTKGLNPNAKMKDSGVEWLGEIPEDWDLKPLKHLASLKGRLGWKGLKADEYVKDGYGFLSTPDIKNDTIDFTAINFITEERYLESPEIMLEISDVLLVKDGSTLGIANIIKELPIPTTVNSSIGIIRVYDKNILAPEFLLWLLKSNYMQTVINRLKAGQGVPHLFQKDIKNFAIILPAIVAQKSIIQFVEGTNNDFNTIINYSLLQIEKLKEYRQSIISEAVTGKIDVREWQPNKQIVA